MRLPVLSDSRRYQGLYVYDFGAWTAVGYTAEEIAILLENEACQDGKVYKIHRAWPDGRMELRGVSLERFRMESGMFFYRGNLDPARGDFSDLSAAGQRTPPPCRARLQLAERSVGAGGTRYVTSLVFPAEYEDEIGVWLSEIGFQGGDLVEGGISHVSNFYEEEPTVIERQQLWSRPTIPSRSAAEVIASVRQPVQRQLGA